MFELPPNIPPAQPISNKTINECVDNASQYFNIHPNVIKAIIAVEGGTIGTMSRNSNRTYDMGVMQINTIHLPALKRKYPGITWKDIAYNPCINIAIGTSILNDRLKEIKPHQNYWRGVGNYHSKTKKFRDRYLKKIYKAYRKIIKNNGNVK